MRLLVRFPKHGRGLMQDAAAAVEKHRAVVALRVDADGLRQQAVAMNGSSWQLEDPPSEEALGEWRMSFFKA
eukprot:3890004-Alexandrium_andersonii.AAC.1